MSEGWIKLHRQVKENPVIMKDADHLAIWVWLLLNATHDEYDVLFQGRRMTLMPGQLITSRRTIKGVLRVDDSKIERVLKFFQNEQQIEQLTTPNNRLITVKNWSSYQKSEPVNEPQVNHDRTTGEPPVNTNKNVKNVRMKRTTVSVSAPENLNGNEKMILATLEFKGYKYTDRFPEWSAEIQRDFPGIDLREVCIAYKNYTKPYSNHLNAFRNFCRQEREKSARHSPSTHAARSAVSASHLPDRIKPGHISQQGTSDLEV